MRRKSKSLKKRKSKSLNKRKKWKKRKRKENIKKQVNISIEIILDRGQTLGIRIDIIKDDFFVCKQLFFYLNKNKTIIEYY